MARAFSVPIESERGSASCFDAFSSREPVSTSLGNALLDEARIKEVVDLRNRFDDADLEQQVCGLLVKGLELAHEEFLVRGLVLPAQIFRRVAELFAGLLHIGT